ncbi:hypothetical protein LTR62_006309 [Meristemomyces frigidus]|uniref:Enoyl reductase (ER) domain-containing protein n=1 Tax=Meristemomyces frigidus TaxID=1508187 RepID=A0AAN7YEN2_9PEZI|nr:hypothetical protein LTR62_006309 [Meristemomyces frigidus]
MTTPPTLPATMRAWQYNTTSNGLEQNLQLNTVPLLQPEPNQHLVKVAYAAINPVDYKPAEIGFISRFLISKPATPGLDIAGKIVVPATGSGLQAGDLVFGCTGQSIFAGGSLREYALVSNSKSIVLAPEGMSLKDVSTVGVAGVTALQSLKPFVKAGDRVVVNGGSGGVGIYAIQIAKALGCSVTATCSSANVDLCLSLGADHVVDYRKQDVVEALQKSGPYDHVVDNVGADWSLYWRAPLYTTARAQYAFVGASPSFGLVGNVLRASLPSFLGGGQRKLNIITSVSLEKDLIQVADYMQAGQVKVVHDSEYSFEHVREAIQKQKTGRARGKIVIEVDGGP